MLQDLQQMSAFAQKFGRALYILSAPGEIADRASNCAPTKKPRARPGLEVVWREF
jgi:hypothetical protein